MILRVLFLISLLLAIAPLGRATEFTAYSCSQLLEANLEKNRALEIKILSQFSADIGDFAKVQELSSPSVYLVPLKDGNKVVLRFAGIGSAPDFENFASRIIQGAPHCATPSTRLLDGPELKPILRALRANTRKSEIPVGPATAAVFFPEPLITGKAYLVNTIGAKFRTELTAYFTNSLASIKNYSKEQLPKLWNELETETKTTLMHDLKLLVPSLREANSENFVEAIFKNAAKFNQPVINTFKICLGQRFQNPFAFNSPTTWALFTVLGVPDFHPNNWLIYNGQVIAIDVAGPGAEFHKGTVTLNLRSHQSPIDFNKISLTLKSQLLRSVSNELLTYLESLHDKELFSTAKEAGFDLNTIQIKGVLGRIHALKLAKQALE